MKLSWKINSLATARTLSRLGLYFVVSLLVISFGTFTAWKLTRLFSPTDSSSGGGTNVTLKSSDHKLSGTTKVPLNNNLTATDSPYYNDTINSGPTPIGQSGNNFTMFRIQGEISYR